MAKKLVTPQSVPTTITQAELVNMRQLRDTKAALEKAIEKLRKSFIERSQAGAAIEQGTHEGELTLEITEREKKKVDWKDQYAEACGPEAVLRVLLAAPVSTELVVDVKVIKPEMEVLQTVDGIQVRKAAEYV